MIWRVESSWLHLKRTVDSRGQGKIFLLNFSIMALILWVFVVTLWEYARSIRLKVACKTLFVGVSCWNHLRFDLSNIVVHTLRWLWFHRKETFCSLFEYVPYSLIFIVTLYAHPTHFELKITCKTPVSGISCGNCLCFGVTNTVFHTYLKITGGSLPASFDG